MSIDTSKLNRYKPGYVHSNDGPGYISMLAREDGEYVRLEDVIAITIALEQALTQQRGEPVASICLVTDRRLPHFAAAEIQLYDGYEPKIGDKLYTTPQPPSAAQPKV